MQVAGFFPTSGQEKKVDYFERAKRLLEIPLLKKQYEEKREDDKKFHDEYEADMIAQAIVEQKEAESCNDHFSTRREEDVMKFKEDLKQRRHAALQEKLVVFEEVLKKAREERLQQRKIERKERRRAEAILMAKAEEEKIAQLRAEKKCEALEERQKERETELKAQQLTQMQREKKVKEKIKERERKYEAERLSKLDKTNQRQPRRVDDWRRKSPEPAKEETRYPPKRQGRGVEDRYPPKRQERGEEDRYPPKRQERGEEDKYPPKHQGRGEEDKYPPKHQGRGEEDRYLLKHQERGRISYKYCPPRRKYNNDRPHRPAGDDRSLGHDDPRDDNRDRHGPPASGRRHKPDRGDQRGGWREGKNRAERSWKDQDVRLSRDVDKRRHHSPRDMERQTNQSPVRKLANDDGFEVVSRRR